MQQAPRRSLVPTPSPPTNQGSCFVAGRRLSALQTVGRLGQGFGPRLEPDRRSRRAQERRGIGVSGGHSTRTAARRRSSASIISQAGQQEQTAVAQPGDGDSVGALPPGLQAQPEARAPATAAAGHADGSGSQANNDSMHGQQAYRQQGLPSSRSDTMLLQSAEQQRFGLGSALGSVLGRSASATPGRGAPGAAGAAAAGDAQQTPRGGSGAGSSIPVYVMLPLDTVNADGVFRYASSKWFSSALQRLAATGIHGVAVDVWWGAVERRPRRYDWAGYRQLFALVRALGLKLQVVMSFHACGGNVGDNAQIPLPQWVLQAGESDPDIFFTDRPRELFPGQRNRECLSFFADEEPGLLRGRSPMQCYVDFMRAFRDEFVLDLGSLIEEVVVGCGPCGELRYPSYPESNGWRFPGVGEFQCYDRRALASLAAAAREAGHPEWGNTGPHDAGSYNANPEETGFFCSWGGNWESAYGRFFLEWYSGALLDHGDRMLTAATSVFNTRRSAGERAWPGAISNGRSRSLPDLPGSSAGGGGGRPQHHAGLPPLPSGGVLAEQRQQQAQQQQQQQQQQQAQQQAAAGEDRPEADAALMYGGGAFDAGLADSYRLQQQQQQQQQQALRPSPSLEMLPASALPSPVASPAVQGLGGDPGSATLSGGSGLAGAAGGVGMRHHASYSSLRSSVSESEEWMGDGGAGCAPSGPPVDLTMKVAGVHWWFRTRSHAAELTAGYYNTDQRDGYSAILQLCARHGAALTLTCVEMCDAQHPPEALCGPEGLLRQVRERAASIGVSVAGENALPCFMPNIIDETALHRIVYNTQPWGTPLQAGAGSSGLDPAGPAAVAAAAAAAATAGAAVGAGVGLSPAAACVAGSPELDCLPGAGTGAAAGAANGGSPPPAAASPGGSSGLGSPSGSNAGDSPASSGSGSGSDKLQAATLPPMRAFTFLRLTDMMMTEGYQRSWAKFMRMMSCNAQRFRTSATWRRGMGFE